MSIAFSVLGLPAPQGSKTKMPNGAMLEGSSRGQRERHRNWRSAVAEAAREAAADLDAPLDGPLTLHVVFRFPMPKSRPRAVRENGRNPKATTPDLDKILRATCDGLEAGGLIANDSRIWHVVATKYEVTGWTGARITVRATS